MYIYTSKHVYVYIYTYTYIHYTHRYYTRCPQAPGPVPYPYPWPCPPWQQQQLPQKLSLAARKKPHKPPLRPMTNDAPSSSPRPVDEPALLEAGGLAYLAVLRVNP